MQTTQRSTMTVEQAAAELGISRGLAYQAAQDGSLPTIRIGRRLLVPRAKLAELLGETPPREADRPTAA
jgi:excisionase family DNA binding protein